LVLVSAFLHASWNALLRVEPDKDRGLVAAVVATSVFSVIVASIRWGAGEPPFATWSSVSAAVLGGMFEAAYFAALARALEVGRLGVVYTVSRGGAVLLVWPLSIALFGEAATVTSSTGSAIVLVGLVIASMSRAGAATRGHRQGVAWAVASAISIAGYHLAYKAGLQSGGSPSATFAASMGLASLISIVRLGRAGRHAVGALFRTRLARVVLMGIVCGGSFLILMEALAIGGSGYVLTLRNTSVLFAVALAATIGERPGRHEVIGAALVAAGAVVMAM
jgi:uncharacterized membrane protein